MFAMDVEQMREVVMLISWGWVSWSSGKEEGFEFEPEAVVEDYVREVADKESARGTPGRCAQSRGGAEANQNPNQPSAIQSTSALPASDLINNLHKCWQ
jgi:hypothetical protein